MTAYIIRIIHNKNITVFHQEEKKTRLKKHMASCMNYCYSRLVTVVVFGFVAIIGLCYSLIKQSTHLALLCIMPSTYGCISIPL